MSRRNKIIITVVTAVVVILLIIIILLLWFNKQPVLDGGPEATQTGIDVPATLPSSSAGLPQASELATGGVDTAADIIAIASTFAERFGSFSTEGNFSNLDALNDIMTIRMKAWVDNYKLTQAVDSADSANTVYYGVTTQSLSAKIIDFDETLGRAEIEVTTQRSEARGSTVNPKTFYQNITLNLTKTGEKWKVDSAEWQ
ncbi:MAG: hypothetical protein CMI53_02140 [Parcubacteria group bacterium]|mgnify:CR=1 FL=1|jgi:hypothetical protein|nr:hypothetical protein [Parcubacteria group bacterium]|tara:strand:+ start:844 stop:1443 length:600 start_codon:yes stop_codon:yes gene_type:complete